MLYINETANGIVFKVWVQPKSARNEIKDLKGDALRVRITAVPVEGKANNACMDFLARELGISKSQVEIIGGHKSRTKVIRVTGVTKGEIERLAIHDLQA
ncbi:MAG: DUF167 domain-containing protein [Thermodesulfobacteriota bacterium]